MAIYDVIVRAGQVAGIGAADVAIADGVIAAVEPDVEGGAREEVPAAGLAVLPGVVDTHVHFNEPGRTEWEGWATGSRALAAGGATACCEMPLNAHPPTLDGESFDLKAAAARASSHVDFGLWGGLVPGNLDRLEELAERDVVGLKAFMSNSGIEDFAAADDLTLLEGMERAAALGLLVGVHAESEALTSALGARARAEGRTGPRDWATSRPPIAELEAIGRALAFAEETGCRLHVVHVSTAAGVELVVRARERGVDATCETCPHYLALDEDDLDRLGAAAKCAPPLRPPGEPDRLWAALAAGDIDLVASDHSPCPPAMKAGDGFEAWGGIAGGQTLLPLLLGDGRLDAETVAAVAATRPAERYGLARKGTLAPGADADVALVDLAADHVLAVEDLHDRHRANPFAGRRFSARVVRTLLRGRTIFADGRIVGEPGGRLLTPAGAPVR